MKNLFYLSLTLFVLNFSSCSKCKDVTCNNGGTCEDGICACLTGFSGTNCEIEDKCITSNVVCNNDGVCVDGTCDCASKYYGEACDDYCVYGTYSNGTCNCSPGYEGETCETESRLDFYGTYDQASTCVTTPGLESTISEYTLADSAQLVSITNISGDGDTKGYARIDGNNLWIPKQTVKGSTGTSWSIESSEVAVLTNNTLVINVIRKSGSFTLNCKHTLTLQ